MEKKALIVKYTSILLSCQLLLWWILYFSPLNIPERIPGTPINVHGLFLITLFVVMFTLGQKSLLRLYPASSVFQLTLFGFLIGLFSETGFQLTRQFTFHDYTLNERLTYFFRGVIIIPLFAGFLSFFVAFRLKTKKPGQLALMVICFMVLLSVLVHFFPGLVGKKDQPTGNSGEVFVELDAEKHPPYLP